MNDVRFEEAPLSPIAGATLREWSDTLDWSWSYASCKDPSNASVARPKTLVELESVEAVQRAKPPPCGDGSFADACASMDDSTGVYLYAKLGSYSGSNDPGVVSYECRQFPRSSGYPEDPATGIAAAALAASLRFGQGTRPSSTNKSYNIYQGTAMGRPSLMQVLNLERDEASGELSFGLQGRVEIDNRSTIHVSE
jgi:predicted PhzF superfamily epimerase YddE/YHI9